MRWRTIFALAALLIATAPAGADDVFRCGSKLIDTSLSMDEVTARCGKPTQRTVEEIPQQARRANGSTYVSGTVVVETWTYDRGSSSFPAVLRFEDGKLVSIELIRP